MATVSLSKKIIENVSKTLFLTSRMTVDCIQRRRGLSDAHKKDEDDTKVKEMDNNSSGEDKKGMKETDPYSAFPNDVNPITGEKGGPRGPEPTRYGDWERKGRCIDF